MAAYQIKLVEEKNVVIDGHTSQSLIASGNGDAVLLYLCLISRKASEPSQLMQLLCWSEAQLDSATSTLCDLGLVQRPDSSPQDIASSVPLPQDSSTQAPSTVTRTLAKSVPAPPAESSMPRYSREDVMNKLESDAAFSAVVTEAEKKLGRLNDMSLKQLLGLYDYLGLPADVLLLLINYCCEKKAKESSINKPPAMKEIVAEGYKWARKELFSLSAADAYIQSERKKQNRFTAYMDSLHLSRRSLAPSEEQYLRSWMEMGFAPEAVAIAYDKTMLRCHELKWPYLSGILSRWHEKGLHTAQEVRAESAGSRPKSNSTSANRNAWMKDYD